MNSKFALKLLSAVLTAAILTSFIPQTGNIRTGAEDFEGTAAAAGGDYNSYAAGFSDYKNAETAIELAADDAQLTGDAALKNDVAGRKAVCWEQGEGSASWSFNAPENSYYNLKLIYASTTTGVDYSFMLEIDGSMPFDEAEALVFPRLWQNAESEFKTDYLGNTLTPEQQEIEGYYEVLARSSTGVTVEPYAFYFTAGDHTLTLRDPGQQAAVAAVVLQPAEITSDYKEVSADYDIADTEADTIVIEGESAAVKSSSSLIPKSDNTDAGMSPSDVMYTRLNYIGGTSWQDAGQFLVWNFDVEEPGYYKLGLRYRQSDVINAESWRWLKIDGKTPFSEAKGIRFPYTAKWDFFEWTDGEKPYYIWLDEGTHTLTLEVTMGDMSEYFYRLSDIVDILGDKYIDMVKVTGTTPDVNLDYELFNLIPDLDAAFEECSGKLQTLAQDLESFTGKRGSQYIAAINNMVRVLDKMRSTPYMAHQYITDYYTNYSSLSSWLYDMIKMPLSIDTIQFAPAGGEFVNKDASFFRKIAYTAEQLIASFTDDYIIETKTAENGGEGLTLWVNWGRDQATSLDTLIRESFTEDTGIPVKVQITNASLINGLLSGNFPDMALHLARTEPVNLGIRGALADLYEFEDIDEILKRFQEGAAIPYEYDGELYALPDTQSFQVMFYRSDILESLGLEVPETWDEFLYAASIIQRNNMSVYIPYTMITASTTINAGIGSLNIFPTLMSQSGLSLYNDELNATALTSVEAISVFDFWTELYTDYDFQKEADFYNRLRVGVMPLGIAPYSTYFTIYSAAPEIRDRWAIACVPGMKGGNNSVAGAGTGCAIIKESRNREEAWEFLKWWTSADTQTRYSKNVESLLGMLGRQTTATVDALKGLAWDNDDLDVLLEQWSRVREVPEVPGSYYLSRAIDQAYWSVLNDDINAKDAITKWSQVADDEIARKIEEYK